MGQLILIVDDERDLVRTLEYNLQRDGFRTRTAFSGRVALEIAASSIVPDLVILDLMLPDIPGTEVCRQLRIADRTREVPILMLTAKSTEIDRVVGFELGADDYVVKPFSIRELLLRIRSILRRVEQFPAKGNEMTVGVLQVDTAAHRVWVEGQEVRLTPLEFKLLSTFLSRSGRVQTRDLLLADVWGLDVDVTTRTIDTHVRRLRGKLRSAARYIETIRGVGYCFTPQPAGKYS